MIVDLRRRGVIFHHTPGSGIFKAFIPAAVDQSLRAAIAAHQDVIIAELCKEIEVFGEHRAHCSRCAREIYLRAPLMAGVAPVCFACGHGCLTFLYLSTQATFSMGMPLCSPN